MPLPRLASVAVAVALAVPVAVPVAVPLAVPLVLAPTPGRAQTRPGEIKGVDAMGDKSRSANDGWSQAPVPREDSAAKDAPNPGGRSTAENRDRKVSDGPADAASATEPQAPIEHRTPAPSGRSPAVPAK